jgi:hypothetical protein
MATDIEKTDPSPGMTVIHLTVRNTIHAICNSSAAETSRRE